MREAFRPSPDHAPVYIRGAFWDCAEVNAIRSLKGISEDRGTASPLQSWEDQFAFESIDLDRGLHAQRVCLEVNSNRKLDQTLNCARGWRLTRHESLHSVSSGTSVQMRRKGSSARVSPGSRS